MTQAFSNLKSSVFPNWLSRFWQRRTPLFMQLESADCGVACLGMVLAHYGRWLSIEVLREECQVGRDGSTLEDIAIAARRHGMKATGQSCRVNQLKNHPLPMILFWAFNHFVVLKRIENDQYYINDPDVGQRVVSRTVFNRDFTGVALVVEPLSTFERVGKRPSIIQRLLPWFQGYGKFLTRSAVYGLLLAFTSLAMPVSLAIFVDTVMENARLDWSHMLIIAMIIAGALTYFLTWLQMRTLRELVVRLAIKQSDRFLDCLFRLPVSFFTRRFAGDIVLTMRLIDQIADTGAGQIVRLAVDLVMSIAIFVVMLTFEPVLSIIVLGLAIICFFLMSALTRLRRDQNHQLRHEQGLVLAMSAAGLKRIEIMKATARENMFFSRWAGRQARELNARQQFVELGHVAAALPELFQGLTAAVVFGIGGWLAVSGEMTIGTLIGFYVLAGNFLRPVTQVAQFSNHLQTLEADLVRVGDVLNAGAQTPSTNQSVNSQKKIVTLDGRLRLIGGLEMRDVTFGFQPNRKPVLENIDLVIEPGQRVAVVGSSGSGKSTLALLAAGLYSPWSGEILYDGYPRAEIPRQVFCRSVAIVDQRPILFSTTIRNNLTMWNPTVPDSHINAATQDAVIHEDIIARPGGYESKVEEGGRNFSGGQSTRLEIARSLVNNPSLLILDEATSALDTAMELEIDDRIRRRGCSCLIIAHRLSTIRDADKIVVVDNGHIVEHGTHEELYANNNIYRRLVDGQ
ncbi:MAG: ATP-binding cassette domain-containing protein [Gammaproteobacteria bacterium]|nr:ATP-binding cassette domain-containing protein [Gammaproteobacteria bacterium]MYI89794.1 ATP-binding cassette domain-containing protein [Gammaproteobacteria bacterium]